MSKKRNKRRKKTNSIIALLVFILLLLIIVFIFVFINSKKVNVILKENTIELNEKIFSTDCVDKIKNGKVVSDKEQIDTSKIGKKEIIIKIKDKFNKVKEYNCIFNVVDRKAPSIAYKSTLETTEGTKIDLLDGVTASDDSKEDIKVTVEGEYDFNKAGEYKLAYVASDSSKNVSRKEFTLVVKKKIVSATTSKTDKIVNFTTSKGFKGYTKNGVTYIDGTLIVNKTYSLPSTYGKGLTENFTTNFNKMKKAASADGISLKVVSGFRSYSTQKSIYNNWVKKDGKAKADTYSARAGYSEHQSGLAADLNHVGSSFDNTKEAKWLEENCYKYGFILRYPKGKQGVTGYIYESWHFRYVGIPLATKLYNNGDWLTLEEYFGVTSKYQ